MTLLFCRYLFTICRGVTEGSLRSPAAIGDMRVISREKKGVFMITIIIIIIIVLLCVVFLLILDCWPERRKTPVAATNFAVLLVPCVLENAEGHPYQFRNSVFVTLSSRYSPTR